MNRQLSMAMLALVLVVAGCGGSGPGAGVPVPPGGEPEPLQVGPLLVRPASAAGFTITELSTPSAPTSYVAMYGSQINYLASQALLDRVVFASNRDGFHDIWICNLDGSNAVQITNNGAKESEPAFSPDGTRIVFERAWPAQDAEIMTMNVDGSTIRAVTDNAIYDGHPTWSPDGRRIAYESEPGANLEVFACYDDGSSPVNLTNNAAADADPDWSSDDDDPDILFSSDRTVDFGIFRMEDDGSIQTVVTNATGADYSPAWSPDAYSIAWQRHEPCEGEIFVAGSSGSSPHNISSDPGCDEHPAWSSNGLWVASDSDRSGNEDIWLQEIEWPWRAYRVTRNSAVDTCPHLGSPAMQTERVLIGPAGSDWGGFDPVWDSAYAGIAAFDSDGYRNFVRIGIRTADLGSLQISPMTQSSAVTTAGMDLMGVLIEANEIVNLREDSGRGTAPTVWDLDAINAGAVVLYLRAYTGKLVSVLCIDDSSYPAGADAPALNLRPDGDAVTVEGHFSAVFDAHGRNLAAAGAGAVRVSGDGSTRVLR